MFCFCANVNVPRELFNLWQFNVLVLAITDDCFDDDDKKNWRKSVFVLFVLRSASAIFHFNKTLAFSFANNLHTTNSDNSEFSSLSEVLHCDWKNLKQQRASSPRIVAKTIYFCNCNSDSSIINQRRTESVPKPDSASTSIQMEMIILQWNCYLSLYISSFNCLHHSDSTFVQTPNWIWWK